MKPPHYSLCDGAEKLDPPAGFAPASPRYQRGASLSTLLRILKWSGTSEVAEGQMEVARPPTSTLPFLLLGAAPSPRSFGGSAAQAGARRTHCVFLRKLVRSAGFAPASPDWHSGILLLNDDRERSGAKPC